MYAYYKTSYLITLQMDCRELHPMLAQFAFGNTKRIRSWAVSVPYLEGRGLHIPHHLKLIHGNHFYARALAHRTQWNRQTEVGEAYGTAGDGEIQYAQHDLGRETVWRRTRRV